MHDDRSVLPSWGRNASPVVNAQIWLTGLKFANCWTADMPMEREEGSFTKGYYRLVARHAQLQLRPRLFVHNLKVIKEMIG